jgi:hypothetical protein
MNGNNKNKILVSDPVRVVLIKLPLFYTNTRKSSLSLSLSLSLGINVFLQG